MSVFKGKIQAFVNNRWLVFVVSMWMMAGAGVGYLFGSISPVIKSSLGYNQRQIASLEVSKNLGDSIGFMAGSLSEVLPFWGLLLVGAIQTFIGYGWVWLSASRRIGQLPLWAVWILIFIGTNGESYYNTAALVCCVRNFPKSRGPIVGILKGFAGLSGAILTQAYALVNSSDNSSLILMIAVGPSLVVIALMFTVRPVNGHRQVRSSDGFSFTFVYSICLLLAAYLLSVMLLEDFVDISYTLTVLFTIILFCILLLPIAIPLVLSFGMNSDAPLEECLLPEPEREEAGISDQTSEEAEIILSEVEEEKPQEVDLLPVDERQKRIVQLQTKLLQAAAEGAVRIKRRRGPRRGEDFTLMQALIKADFWLIFFSLMLGSGSGLTVIDNMGQMSASLGYDDAHIFVSLISIWNFLGRVAGGFFSELIVRDYSFPRPLALAIFQVVMASGHFILAMAWPGALYISTLLVGLGYGAHWAIIPATASELFGLKNFGALYNCIAAANPAGSLLFSGLIASTIYDYEATQQAQQSSNSSSLLTFFLSRKLKSEEVLECTGAICFFFTCLLMSGFCIVGVVMSLALAYRTRTVYTNLYGRARSQR